METLDTLTVLSQIPTSTIGYYDTSVPSNSNCIQYSYYPCWYAGSTSDRKPVKLTLGEVELLRKAAKGDDKLKAVLNKVAPFIEVRVEM